MKTNIYILGGEGFIGMNLAEYFANVLEYNVVLISNRPSIFNLPKGIQVEKNYCDIYDCNFIIDPNSIIIHLARREYDPEMFYMKEYNLKEYILKSNPSKIIAFSSSIIYRNEDSKYKKEKEIFENIWGNKALLIRLFNTYGKYQLPNKQGGLIPTLLYNDMIHSKTTLNDINQSRNFIFAGDIGKVLHQLFNNFSNKVIDVGYESISFKTLLEDYLFNFISQDSIIIGDKLEPLFELEPKDNINISYTFLSEGLYITQDFIKNNISKIK